MGIIGVLSVWAANAADTSCWATYSWTVPTPFASWIVYWCDNETNPWKSIPIITIYWENANWSGVWITIKAMNEWTWTVTIWSWSDTSSYWSLYQWWNNYPFPNVSDTSTPISSDSSNCVSTAWYGPNTELWYYNSGTWMKQSWWDCSSNLNLWWWNGDNQDDGTSNWMRWYNTGTFEVINSWGRRWMCDTWYHIPSAWEWSALVYLWWRNYDVKQSTDKFDSLSLNTLCSKTSLNWTWTRFSYDMQMPFIGYRNNKYEPNPWSYGRYWSSSPHESEISKYFWLSDSAIRANTYDVIAYGWAVRCFKNFYVKSAPSTFIITFTGSGQGSISTWSIEVEEWTSISRDDGAGSVTISWTVVATGIANEWYVFSWWLTDCGATVTTACNFTGEFKPITYTISFSWNAADVTWTVPAIINAEYDSGDIAPDNSFTLTGYTFTWWNTESDGTWTGYATWAELKNLTTTSGADVVLYAQWEANIHKLSFVVDWTTIQSGDVAYSTAISASADPTKDSCNSFAGWTSSVEWLTTTGTMPDSDVTFTANWNYTCSRSSGWWGGGSSKTTTTNTTWTVTTWTNETNVKSDTQDEEIQEDEDEWEIQEDKDEFQRAYEFAYKHGITTMPTIEEANMTWTLTRIAMAKMLSYYAINILWMKPDETRVNKFNDVSEKLNAEYNSAVTLAYQLWIMWINMPKNNFRPNDLVTRWEFATALSRMLYWIADWKDKYYSTHLAKLMEEKIITNDDPKMKELRGYVMIMLMRSAENKSTEN